MSNTNTSLPTQTSSVLKNDIVSSCSTSKVQEKIQLSRSRCMNSLREVKSQFKFLSETLQDFSTMPVFKRTFSQDLDLLEQCLTKDILSQTDYKTILTKLRTTFGNAFNLEFKEHMQKYTRFNAQYFQDAMICNMDSIQKYMLEITLHQQRTPQLLKQKKLMQTQEDNSNPIPALNVDSLKVDLVVIQNTCSEKEDSNSDTASSKSVKQSSLNSETKDVHAIKYKMPRIEHEFKRAFTSLFGKDADISQARCFQHRNNYKQLDKDEFQEDGSMSAFLVINKQFQQFIDSKFTLDYNSQMTNKYFVEYTGIEVKHFKDTLLKHMEQKSKIDTGKAVDNGLVVMESNGTESEVQDDNSRSGNDTDADDADIRPIYDEEPMAEAENGSIHNLSVLHSDIDTADGHHGLMMQCSTPSIHLGFSQMKLVLFVTEIHMLSIDISLEIVVNMEILLEPTSNKLSVAQDDRERQIKMIQVKEMMQDKDLKNSKSKDKGSRSRSRGMNEQSHYKQDKTKEGEAQTSKHQRKYPLTKETLERVMSLKLIAASASDSDYDLLRFIQKHIDEAGSHNGGDKDI
ncbi:hypothetical protein Tco_0760884 [Tanacetum coccineum]